MKQLVPMLAAAWVLLACAWPARATETENLNFRILPTPGKVAIDGHVGDWDLSGGAFVCSDVQTLRDKMGLWVHAMYDADNLYVLARWIDETPMSNPGSIAGDHGWNGDSLQLRIIADPDAKNPLPICWVTAWRDRDGKDVVGLDFPKKTREPLKDAKAKGARQAFRANADGDPKGYVQELALPWKLLIAGGITPKPGGRIIFSVEANFNTPSNRRISMKGIFRPDVTPDRVFTFTATRCWGFATFEPRGKDQPRKLRLADRREFAVAMKDGKPVVDWTGLLKAKKAQGFAKIHLDVPADGFVSLNIKNAEGRVVRQLLAATPMKKGRHELLWDGLTNTSHLRPGEVVKPGTYMWEAIHHRGLGLRLVGWADNAGKAPYDCPGGNWGGDHGKPSAAGADDKHVYLGWDASEAGRAVVCLDSDGNVLWRHKHGGFGGARHISAGDGIVYVNDGHEKVVYRIDAAKGTYQPWQGKDTATIPVGDGLAGMAWSGGKLYLSQGKGVRVLDGETGQQRKTIAVAEPGDLEAAADGTVYVLAGSKQVMRIGGDGKPVVAITGLTAARALAVGKNGEIYVGVGDPDNQVLVYDRAGKLVRRIGKGGGRPLLGPWDSSGMRFIAGLAVDARGRLWVAEHDDRPKRFSCWRAKDGSFVKEFFGPTAYGALGGAISPTDPLVMVGSGCEWRLDAKTGRATCVGVFHRGNMSNARFGQGPGGRLYVAVAEGWIHGHNAVSIYQRLAAGRYKKRTRLEPIQEAPQPNRRGRDKLVGIRVWSDANDDQQEQPAEVREYRMDLGGWITGWYLPMTQTMRFYGSRYCLAPTGWTKCGAPRYDVTKAKRLPAPDDLERRGGMGSQRGCGSADGTLMVYNGHYGVNHSDFVCYNVETGRVKWTYPNNYVGVHGGHRAPPPQIGMIRGAYDIVGTGKLPEPIGDIFVIGTDKGEWHILTGEGFYLSKLFEGDPLKIRWPAKAVPGAVMDTCPPGMGSEDFGGSITVTDRGELYLQAGKTAYINVKVVGLDSVRRLQGGRLQVKPGDLALARAIREQRLQAEVGTRSCRVKKRSVHFTGNLRKDFAVREPLRFEKNPAARIETAMAYDDENLYLGWQVSDDTPWVNGASDPARMYAMGDTVDFQIGTDPAANPKRRAPVLGDLRLSIGNLAGTPTAVLYRPLAKHKKPRKFFSGVVRQGYEMQSVDVLASARIQVKVDAKHNRYTVQAAIPLASLGLRIRPGLKLIGDIGATHGDAAGKDTILRTYWNNQKTGLISDEVFELKLTPANWGQFVFE